MVELMRAEKVRTIYQRPGHADTLVSIDIVTGADAFVETEVLATDSAAAATYLETSNRQSVCPPTR